jgi:hypothetical protein
MHSTPGVSFLNLAGGERIGLVQRLWRIAKLYVRIIRYALASKAKIFDLIKVDYVVKDPAIVQAKLMDDAAQVIKQKAAQYERLLGIKLQPPVQVYAEKPSIYFPTEMYDSYAASESEEMSGDNDRQKYTIQGARKSRTFFFNGLNADGFDHVTNPVVIEPVVQFTLYLKVKFEIEPARK